MIENIKNNKIKYLYPSLALISFLTWFIQVPQLINFIIYGLILLTLIIFKFDNKTLIFYSLFVLIANRNMDWLSFHFQYQFTFIVIALKFMVESIYHKNKIEGKLLLPIVITIVYAFISLIWTIKLVAGLSEISIIIQGYVAYMIFRNSKEEMSFKEVSWIFSFLLLALSFEYLTLTLPTVHNFDKVVLDQFWSNSNLVAAIIGVTWIPSLYKYFDKDRSKYTFLYLPLELLVIYAIIIGSSFALQLSFIAVAVIIPIYFLIKNKKVFYTLLISSVIIVMIFIVTVVLLKDTYPEFFAKMDRFSTNRFKIYAIAIEQLKNPLVLIFGRGIGSANPILGRNYYFHNLILHILVNRGLIGLSVTIFMLFKALRVFNENKTTFKYFAALGMLTYLGHSLFDIGFEYQFLGVCFFLMIALLEVDNKKTLENLTI